VRGGDWPGGARVGRLRQHEKGPARGVEPFGSTEHVEHVERRNLQPVPDAVAYTVHLTGSGGASALAGLDVKAPATQLCWRFTQLKNVTISRSAALPSIAVIQLLHQGRPRLVLGIPYKSSGCIEGTPEFSDEPGAQTRTGSASASSTRRPVATCAGTSERRRPSPLGPRASQAAARAHPLCGERELR